MDGLDEQYDEGIWRGLDQAPRPSISNVIWVLSSDTDTICQLNQLNTNSEAAMLSKEDSYLWLTPYAWNWYLSS